MHGNTGFHHEPIIPFQVGELVEVSDRLSPFYLWSGTVKAVWPADTTGEAHYRVEASFVDHEPPLSLTFRHSQLANQDIPF